MAVSFDPSKIAMFRDAQFAGASDIANLDKGDKLKTKDSYYGKLGALFRSSATEARNNAVRTELLKSLGQAFGLSGMTESDGKVSFSKDFMDRLESLLGRDVFKRADFKIGADGTVTSGRPLTSRRINAIITKATEIGRGPFDLKDYSKKFEMVQRDLAKLDRTSGLNERFQKYFQHVGKCLDFLKGFDGLIIENETWSVNDLLGESNEGVSRYLIKDPQVKDPQAKTNGTGRVPIFTKGNLATWLNEQCPIHGLFHVELYKNIPTEIKSPEDLKKLTDYVRSTVTLYVQSAIDLYLDAKEAGKLDGFIDGINTEAGACMDAKASRPGEIRKNLGLLTDEVPGEVLFAEHDAKTTLDKCLYEEIKVANKQMPGGAKGWNDVADAVKKALVGQVRPIMTLGKSGMIEPLVEGGKQVVRAITEEDIDRIGPTCADILGIF